MAVDGLSSLPDRPLTDADLRSLASHPDIGTCDPIYQLGDDPNAIISVTLELNNQLNVLVFNPDDERWEVGESIAEPESLTADSGPAGNGIRDRFERYYDEEEVTLTGSLQDVTNVMKALAATFPETPLTEAQLRAIDRRGFVAAVSPFLLRTSDDRIVSLVLSCASPTDAKPMVGTYGYDPPSGTWQLIRTAAGADEEEVFDAVGVDTEEWLFAENRYAREDVRAAEDPESWTASE